MLQWSAQGFCVCELPAVQLSFYFDVMWVSSLNPLEQVGLGSPSLDHMGGAIWVGLSRLITDQRVSI